MLGTASLFISRVGLHTTIDPTSGQQSFAIAHAKFKNNFDEILVEPRTISNITDWRLLKPIDSLSNICGLKLTVAFMIQSL